VRWNWNRTPVEPVVFECIKGVHETQVKQVEELSDTDDWDVLCKRTLEKSTSVELTLTYSNQEC